MTTVDLATWKIAVCSHSNIIFNHIDICISKYANSTNSLRAEYVGMGKALLNSNRYRSSDALFLDIDVLDVECFSLLRQLRKYDPDFLLILLINDIDQAMSGYEFRAFRCLKKTNLSKELDSHIEAILFEIGFGRDMVELHCSDRYHKVYVDQILYAEVQHHTVAIHYLGSHHEQHHLTNTIVNVEELLGSYGFCRISRSFIVNLHHVDRITYEWAVLCNGEKLPIGKDRFHTARALHQSIQDERTSAK